MENQYVIAVFENNVAIYNANTGDLLQQDANLDGKHVGMKFKYRNAATKITMNDTAGSDVYLLSYNQAEKKGTIQSEVSMLKEVNWEQ